MTLTVDLDPAGENGALSPDRPEAVEVGSWRWPTVTHLLLAARRWFDDDLAAAIRAAPTVAAAHEAARGPSYEDFPPDPELYWQESRDNFVTRAVHERVMTDVAFLDAVMATADARVTLASPDPWLGPPGEAWGEAIVAARERMRVVDRVTLRGWMLPPVVALPELPARSIGWRMGYGEDYAIRFWEWRQRLAAPDELLFRQAWARASR
jgi:hypothetical protein